MLTNATMNLMKKAVKASFVDTGVITETEFGEIFKKLKEPQKDKGGDKETVLLSRKKAAALLGISTRTLDRLPTDKLPRRQVGKRLVKYLMRDLENYLEINQ